MLSLTENNNSEGFPTVQRTGRGRILGLREDEITLFKVSNNTQGI